MKKSLLFFLLLCTYQINLSIDNKLFSNSKLFSGSIEFPMLIDYDLCIFYNGQKLELESNNTPFVQFSFLDDKSISTIHLVIANALACSTMESNNIRALKIADNNAYICYQLQAQRNFENNEEQLTWNIDQCALENNQIPQNSVIFLFDPTLIAGLKIQSFKPENLFRIIPTIMINSRTTIQQIKRAMEVARLASLDIDPIHRKPELITSTAALVSARS
ncbi:hypothetical protein KAZ82_00875 [Candidatus Babeliales bacterium]|nr:hypothetical protein [Candidatus Babeliales bacterium]